MNLAADVMEVVSTGVVAALVAFVIVLFGKPLASTTRASPR